jgi:putative ubiquitin-RnfH superfamily antitoxin RatB of RatAB toxin-antitoxin module
MPEMLTIEVIYALPTKQQLVSVRLAGGQHRAAGDRGFGTAAEASRKSIWRKTRSVFSRSSASSTPSLRDHDRVEIYRPLIADPKEVRKQRAAEGKVMKKGAGDSEVE